MVVAENASFVHHERGRHLQRVAHWIANSMARKQGWDGFEDVSRTKNGQERTALNAE
jgi:hypothetical protein